MRSFMIQVTPVGVLAAPAFAVDFYNIATIDTQALISSVSAPGVNLCRPTLRRTGRIDRFLL